MTTRKLTITALTVALVTVVTMAISIPISGTQGYLNFGDIMIFASAFLFGPQVGIIAGGIGSALADLLGGFPAWIPITLVAKGLEGYIAGKVCYNAKSKTQKLVGIVAAGFSMVFVYYMGLVITLSFSNKEFVNALLGGFAEVPFNILQVVVGAVGGSILSVFLKDKIKL
ncbi:MAG: ECF transporter S component [Epulopiscium sp.]|nr:ECF transporter S component [Candidatus Epulonipiscium sp.]